MGLLELTPSGLYCAAANAYVDPWGAVDRAIITHGHSDHARFGSQRYLCHRDSVPILHARLGDVSVEGLDYGETIQLGNAQISLHPAGHVCGSAQVRIEHQGEVWVVSGDYKTDADPTCDNFEPVKCHGFVTEATFALPVYRWPAPDEIAAEIDAWWAENQSLNRTSILFAYSLGKAQRALAMLPQIRGPIFAHGAVLRMVEVYRSLGIDLPPVTHASGEAIKKADGQALVIAPPSADGSPWLRRFGTVSKAVASGWMRIRGARRRRAVDRGFVLSDHADWDGLNRTVRATGAEEVWVTHGFTDIYARWLNEQGVVARPIETRFKSETIEEALPEEPSQASTQ
jgi:putative mRNA 3-end processing factor